MSEFLLLFRTEPVQGELSPEAVQAMLAQWQAWIGGIASQGKFVGTNQLLPHGKVVSGAAKKVTDGPFTEGKEIIGGYMFIKAADIAEAIEHAKGCPIFAHGGNVEVRPVLQMQM
jgi:hypothetical protein